MSGNQGEQGVVGPRGPKGEKGDPGLKVWILPAYIAVGLTIVFLVSMWVAINTSELVSDLRDASIQACERTNTVREEVSLQTIQSLENLKALRPELFNITEEEFTLIVAEREAQAAETLERLEPIVCEDEHPEESTALSFP